MNQWLTPGRIMSSALTHFGKQSKAALLTKAYLTTLLITVIDYMTGPELSLLIFYFFPITVISWFVGKRQGIGIALFATFATALHDLLQADSSLVLAAQDVSHTWRILQTGGVFLMVSFIIAALRVSEGEKRTIEHRLARTVQSFLLPQTAQSAGSLTCFGRCKSSDHLTGDFFDLIPLGPMKLAIVVGDVCGKGISAALLMAYIQGLLQSHVPFVEESLGELMNNVNRSLHRVTADDRFATLFIGVYDEQNCLLTYVNAGHDPPVVFQFPTATARGGQREILQDARPIHRVTGTITPIDAVKLETGGLLLGVDPNFAYQTMSHKLHDGDILVCDTDGMKDAMDHQGRMYGADKLIHVVASHYRESAERIIDVIFQDVERFAGQKAQTDDITLVVGKVSVCPPSPDV
jgi:serine phosphatase RsbU (regulator of sigma subunit)